MQAGCVVAYARAKSSNAFWWKISKSLLQLLEPYRVRFDVGVVVEAFAHNDMHHAQGQCSVGPRQWADMPVGRVRSPCLDGVDHNNFCTG
jgi:hypothetical protein